MSAKFVPVVGPEGAPIEQLARVPQELVTGDPQKARAKRIHGPLTVMLNGRPKRAEAKWGYTNEKGEKYIGFAVIDRGPLASQESSVAVSDEGSQWIRGHYDKKAPEIAALKAAYAL